MGGLLERDGNLSAANALTGKAGEAVADGIAQKAIEGRVRDVIQSVLGVQQIALKANSHGLAASVGSTEVAHVLD